MELHSSLPASLWRETLCAGGVQREHVALDVALSRVCGEVASWLTWMQKGLSVSVCLPPRCCRATEDPLLGV